jgi:hypothetical protein
MTADHTTDDRIHSRGHRRDRSAVPVIAPSLLPLQRVSIEQGATSTVETVVLFALAAVGALLTYQAVRGYRRNDDRSMALFAGGLFLLTVVHAGLKLFLTFVPPLVGGGGAAVVFAVAWTSQMVDLAGLAAIFFAILR